MRPCYFCGLIAAGDRVVLFWNLGYETEVLEYAHPECVARAAAILQQETSKAKFLKAGGA